MECPQHSVSGQRYYYNEVNHETMWNRPQVEREPPELYKLRPEHRSLLGEQPSDQLESLPSLDGSIKPDDIKRALETVSMSELELKTKLRTIGPGLYLAKVIFDSTMNWFRRGHKFAGDQRTAREEKYRRDVILCQAACRGWLERSRARRESFSGARAGCLAGRFARRSPSFLQTRHALSIRGRRAL